MGIACTPGNDINLVQLRPVQAVLDPEPLVQKKRTTLELQITSSFSADRQIEVRLAKNDGSAVLALLTDETGQHVSLASVRTHLTVHPGSGTYFWPPTLAPLIGFPSINLNDILPDTNPWCISVTLDPGTEDTNPANNSASSCFASKEVRALPTLIVPVGNATSCDDLAAFEGAWDDLFLGSYPIPEFPVLHGVQIENGRDLSAKRCPEMAPPIPLPVITSESQVFDLLVELDGLRTGTDFENVIGVTAISGTLPGGADGWASLTGGPKGVWIAKNADNFAVSALQEIAHTYKWVTPGAPNECASGHLCNVPAQGYWVARDAQVATARDFMEPQGSPEFRWISTETYEYLLSALKVGADPAVIEVRGIIRNDKTVDLKPWFQFEARPDVALGESGNLVFEYLDDSGKPLATTGTSFGPARLSDGRILDRGYVSLRIPVVPKTARIRATLDGTPIFERPVSRHAPTLRLVNPRRGLIAKVGDRIAVDWEGSDSDADDKLTYAVYIRRDSRSAWVPLAVGTAKTHLEYVVPADLGAGPALVRVLATDGVNTAEATSAN
jgi:hypothetical protein